MVVLVVFFSSIILCYLLGFAYWSYWGYLLSFEFFLNEFVMFKVCLDDLSFTCLIMLVVCCLNVVPYVGHYSAPVTYINLKYLVAFFIITMSFLILSGNIIFSLSGWELLGAVSGLLIVYNCSFSSIRACCTTFSVSRLGDVALFVLAACEHSVFGSFITFITLYIFIVATKSASYPLITWLLEAMRAPTPVSALVHSSTLVTVGVWFSVRYDLGHDEFVSIILSSLSLFTISVTALLAALNNDLKQIVALSTCNNIAWALLCYIYGGVSVCITMLIIHGVSKCVLFIYSGDVLCSTYHSQHSSNFAGSRYTSNLSSLFYFVIACCLIGFPFAGVYFAKHVVVSLMSLDGNSLLLPWIYFNMFLTFVYGYRFCFKMLNKALSPSAISLRSFLLAYLLVIFPSVLDWFPLCLIDEFEFCSEYSFILNVSTWIVHFLGFILGWLIYSGKIGSSGFYLFSYSLGGCSYLSTYVYNLVIHSSISFYGLSVLLEKFLVNNFRDLLCSGYLVLNLRLFIYILIPPGVFLFIVHNLILGSLF